MGVPNISQHLQNPSQTSAKIFEIAIVLSHPGETAFEGSSIVGVRQNRIHTMKVWAQALAAKHEKRQNPSFFLAEREI